MLVYDKGGIKLFHGDARDILPQLPSVDLVITDPPYGMNFRSNHRIVRHRAILGDDALPLDLIWLAIQKAQRAAYVFCRWDNIPAMPPPKSVLAWVKNNWGMGDLKHEHGRQWEAICFYPQSSHEFIRRISDVLECRRTGNSLHPTQKPVELLRRIIACNVGDTVLDCFAGSGTTLLAAKMEGRKAIGIEADAEYCKTIVSRLDAE